MAKTHRVVNPENNNHRKLRTRLEKYLGAAITNNINKVMDAPDHVLLKLSIGDIAKGTPKDPGGCMIARCMERKQPLGITHAVIGRSSAYGVAGRTLYQFEVPPDTRKELELFDRIAHKVPAAELVKRIKPLRLKVPSPRKSLETYAKNRQYGGGGSGSRKVTNPRKYLAVGGAKPVSGTLAQAKKAGQWGGRESGNRKLPVARIHEVRHHL